MTVRERWGILGLVVVSGLMGGFISEWVRQETPAFAQKRSEPDKIVTAQEFQVIDRNGIVVASLGASSGKAQLIFYDQGNKPQAIFGLLNDGSPGFSFFGKDGVSQAELRVGSMGHPSLKLNDVKGKKIALLGAHGLGLFNKNLRGRLTLTSDGMLNLDLLDRDSQTSSNLMLFSSQKPTMVLSDQGGKVIWSAP